MPRLIVACLAVVAAAGPAAACINDVELPAHEREFRSQYHGPAATPSSSPPKPTGQPSTGLLVGTGAVLLAGAVALALSGRRAGN
jgi:hypothetical protein